MDPVSLIRSRVKRGGTSDTTYRFQITVYRAVLNAYAVLLQPRVRDFDHLGDSCFPRTTALPNVANQKFSLWGREQPFNPRIQSLSPNQRYWL